MNFKAKYCADMQNIRPSEQLLASVKELSQAAPARRRTGYFTAAALSAAVLTLALIVPGVLPEKPANEAVAPADYGLRMAQSERYLPDVPETAVYGNRSTNTGSAPENLSGDAPENTPEIAMGDAPEGATEDEAVMKHEFVACGAYAGEDLTEADLADRPEYAAFLPQNAPPGMSFESASLFDGEEASLIVNWTDGGYDYLTLRISPFTAADEERLADITATETWDRTLYGDLPLCDVPQELLPTLDCPIFAAADFTREVLGKRAADSDQNAKYIRFGIRSGDHLLEYTAHTTDVDGVWQAVSSAEIFAIFDCRS